MSERLVLKNRLKEARQAKGLSQAALAEMVGVSRNTISSIETGQFSPTAKLALILCIALDKKFEDLFYFDLCIPGAELWERWFSRDRPDKFVALSQFSSSCCLV